MELSVAYPSVFPSDAVTVIVGKVRGVGGHTNACCVQAGWALLGYALGQIVPADHAAMHAAQPLADEELCAALEALRDNTGSGYRAFDWAQVAKALLPLLLKLLAGL